MTQIEAPRFRKLDLDQVPPDGYTLHLKALGSDIPTRVFLTDRQATLLFPLIHALRALDPAREGVRLVAVWNPEENARNRGVYIPSTLLEHQSASA